MQGKDFHGTFPPNTHLKICDKYHGSGLWCSISLQSRLWSPQGPCLSAVGRSVSVSQHHLRSWHHHYPPPQQHSTGISPHHLLSPFIPGHFSFLFWCVSTFSHGMGFIISHQMNTVQLVTVVVVQSLSCVWLFANPWTVALQAPLSMGFSRQEYWSG